MGQTLEVKAGQIVTLVVKAHDPFGTNFCPLDMDNPSLAQVGISAPLNKPVLRYIDLIAGEFAQPIDPSDDPAYTDDTNSTTRVVKRYTNRFNRGGWSIFRYSFRSDRTKYDVIISDLFHPARDGAGFLYTFDLRSLIPCSRAWRIRLIPTPAPLSSSRKTMRSFNAFRYNRYSSFAEMLGMTVSV